MADCLARNHGRLVCWYLKKIKIFLCFLSIIYCINAVPAIPTKYKNPQVIWLSGFFIVGGENETAQCRRLKPSCSLTALNCSFKNCRWVCSFLRLILQTLLLAPLASVAQRRFCALVLVAQVHSQKPAGGQPFQRWRVVRRVVGVE